MWWPRSSTQLLFPWCHGKTQDCMCLPRSLPAQDSSGIGHGSLHSSHTGTWRLVLEQIVLNGTITSLRLGLQGIREVRSSFVSNSTTFSPSPVSFQISFLVEVGTCPLPSHRWHVAPWKCPSVGGRALAVTLGSRGELSPPCLHCFVCCCVFSSLFVFPKLSSMLILYKRNTYCFYELLAIIAW